MDNDERSIDEMVAYNRKFKKAILDVMFTICDTLYMHCMPNPLLKIGKRGLLEREEKEGIVLVFGPHSTRDLSWDDNFIYCSIQFNGWEQVSIPFECIARMYDKNGHVIMQWVTLVGSKSDPEQIKAKTSTAEKTKEITQEKNLKHSKVIEVDFTKKKKD